MAGGGEKYYGQRYNSWGRTRGPKNIAGDPGTEIEVLSDTTLLKGITAAAVGGVGYATENQRYLHVLICDKHTTAPAATTVFGYCHAFLRWFEIAEGNMVSKNDNTAMAAASISLGDSGRAQTAQIPSDREHRIYEIVGIDRVAFVNSDPTEVAVFAACSSF